MNRLTRRLLRRSEPEPSLYICPWCGEAVDQQGPDDDLTVNKHRLLHLAKEWGDSLEDSTGWIMDEDGGLRPLAD
jgi:hypothetical protein